MHRPDGSPIADGDDVLVTMGAEPQDWPDITDAPELATFARACANCGQPSGHGRLCAACYLRIEV